MPAHDALTPRPCSCRSVTKSPCHGLVAGLNRSSLGYIFTAYFFLVQANIRIIHIFPSYQVGSVLISEQWVHPPLHQEFKERTCVSSCSFKIFPSSLFPHVFCPFPGGLPWSCSSMSSVVWMVTWLLRPLLPWAQLNTDAQQVDSL